MSVAWHHDPIILTGHAVQQFRVRFPGERERKQSELRAEIGSAIREGRLAKTAPPGFRFQGRSKAVKSGRFVWTESRTRAWVIRRRANEIKVITCLRAL